MTRQSSIQQSILTIKLLKKNQLYLLSLFPLYLFICIFGVVYFSLFFNIGCGNSISWSSYYFYIAYGTLTFFIEFFIIKRCLNFISHLVPSLEIDITPGLFTPITNYFKQLIIDSQLINQWLIGYLYSFIQSQLSRFDNFTNVSFLYSTY